MYSLIGSGGKKVKSIIEESGVEAIDMQDDGIVRSTGLCFSFFFYIMVVSPSQIFQHFSLSKVKIMANNVASLERAKAIISGLTMVPVLGDIYR